MNTLDTTASLHPIEDLEAFQELRSRASGKLGNLPGDMVARHVLSVTTGADWPVQRAALEAIIRRLSFARRDGLEVGSRPRGSVGLGLYGTRQGRDGCRPYLTQLAAIEPLIGSCACKDFQKGGLGLCKHLLVVLEDLQSKPSKWRRALAAGLGYATRSSRLIWDPVRPFTGPGDWLDRVAWSLGTAEEENGVPAVVADWFTQTAPGAWTMGEGAPSDAHTRLRLVEDLQHYLRQQGPSRPLLSHDPALDPLLDGERRRLQRRLDGEANRENHRSALETIKRPLYPYQTEGTASFLATGRLLLADDMGLGKTAQAIAACHALWHRGEVNRGLLVVPAPLKSQWAREWALFSDAPVRVVEGPPAERETIYRENDKGFLIANYEQVLRDLALIHGWSPDMIVLDEAQRIKNWATKTAGLRQTTSAAPYRLVLTGTPMENRLERAGLDHGLGRRARALEPKWRLDTLARHRCATGPRRSAAPAISTRCARALAAAMVRRVRQEVLDQLPSRTDTRVPGAN